jgi:hypothetical protein
MSIVMIFLAEKTTISDMMPPMFPATAIAAWFSGKIDLLSRKAHNFRGMTDALYL